MAITSNIFVNIIAWAPSTSYSVGDRRTNGGSAYQCITAGISASSGGPAGTGLSIADGAAVWKYLAHADYITLGSWAAGIPGALTQPIIGVLWDCGAITTAVGTAYLSLSGHTTSSTNTITLKAAPGDGIRDIVAGGGTLALHASSGVRFILPSGVGGTNYFVVTDANVIFEGLQFQDPFPTSNSSVIIVPQPGTLTLRDSIIDGYVQTGGASLLDIPSPIAAYNCVFVDRSAGGTSTVAVGLYAGATASRFVNCDFIAPNGPISNCGAIQSAVSGCYVRNCIFSGYATPNFGGSVNIAFDHSATDVASFGTFTTDSGGNVFSVSPQFVNATSDFRLKAGSTLIGKGIVDTVDIPENNDISGNTRVGWDLGPWAYIVQASGSARILPLSSASLIGAAFSNGFSNGFAIGSFPDSAAGGGRIALAAAGLAAQNSRASATARVVFLTSASTATQSNGSQSGGDPWSADFSTDFGPITQTINVNLVTFITVLSPIGLMTLSQPVTASASLASLSSSSSVSVFNATAQLTILPLAASGIATQLGATVSLMAMSCVATATPSLQFLGVANIDLRLLSASLASSTNAHASASIGLQAVATATTQRLASGLATVFPLAINSAIGLSCSATVSLLGLAPSVGISQFDIASGIASIEIIAFRSPTSPFIQSDATTPLTLAADGSGLLLAADVVQANITSQTSCSGLANIPTLSCAAQSFLQIFWSGTEALSITTTAQAQQFDPVSGTAVIPSLSAAASALQIGLAFGTGTVEQLAASGSLGQRNAAAGLAALPAISAFGSIPVLASARTTVFPVSGGAFVGIGDPAFASASLAALSVTAFVSDWSYGFSSWVIGASGQVTQSDPVNVTSTILPLSALASLASNTSVNAIAPIEAISAAALAGQSNSGAGIATVLPLSCIATSPDWCLGTNRFFTLSAAGFGGVGDPAFARSSFLSLSASATGTTPLGATCKAQIIPLSATGGVSLAATGNASFTITSAVALGQSDGVIAAAAFNIAATAFIPDWCVAKSSIGWTAAAIVNQFDLASGIGTIQSSASGALLMSTGATCAVSLPPLSVSATAGLFIFANSLTSVLPVSAAGAVSDWAFGLAAIPSIRCASAATQIGVASGNSSLPTIAAIGSATLNNAVSGSSIVPALRAAGVAINDVRLAQGAASIIPLDAFATAVINGASVVASASINFSANGETMGSVEAAVLVELEQIVAAHAKLWITPIGYEQGDQVVYWAD